MSDTPRQTGAVSSESSEPADQQAKSPEELQRDIERTREELGDTVDALSQKADVKAQVKSTVDEQKENLRAKGEELKDKIGGGGGGGGGGAGDAAKRAQGVLEDVAQRASRQPLPYLGGALVAGIVIGRILTRKGRR